MRKRLLAMVLSASMMVGMVTPVTSDAAKKFKVSAKKVSVKAGKTKKVKYKAPGKIKVKMKSKKTAKAVVKKKYILFKGVKKGKTNAVVSCGRKKLNIKITVTSKKDNKNKKQAKEKPVKDNKNKIQATEKTVIGKDVAVKLGKHAASMNSFACNMFAGTKKNDANTFISPFSIYTALIMLANGATDTTRDEILKTLGIDNLDDYNSVLSGYMAGTLDEEITLDIANSIWFSKSPVFNKNIDKDFIEPVSSKFGCDVYRNVPFDNETVKQVNGWCDKKTKGLIKKVVDSFEADTVMALINSIYFKSRWKNQFLENGSMIKDFRGIQKTSQVTMMRNMDTNNKYYSDDKFTAIELPYGRDGMYAMDILISSDTNKYTSDVWNGLTTDEKIAAINKLGMYGDSTNSRIIDLIEMPKFELDYTVPNFKSVLEANGMKTAFDENNASFKKIGDKIYVDSVIHKAKIKVDENGTEAAAVTAVIVKEASAIIKPAEKIEFIADRPFIFCIRDTVSGTILFIGEVNDL